MRRRWQRNIRERRNPLTYLGNRRKPSFVILPIVMMEAAKSDFDAENLRPLRSETVMKGNRDQGR